MGSLNFRIVTDHIKGLIRVDFQKKVGSIGFNLAEANAFLKVFQLHINALQDKQIGGYLDGRRDQRDN